MATVVNTVRGGGLGSQAWVARITGPDERYGLARRFVRAEKHLSRSGGSGTIVFSLDEPGYYEFRGLMDYSRSIADGTYSGFWRVDADDSLHAVERAEVVAAVTGPHPSVVPNEEGEE